WRTAAPGSRSAWSPTWSPSCESWSPTWSRERPAGGRGRPAPADRDLQPFRVDLAGDVRPRALHGGGAPGVVRALLERRPAPPPRRRGGRRDPRLRDQQPLAREARL